MWKEDLQHGRESQWVGLIWPWLFWLCSHTSAAMSTCNSKMFPSKTIRTDGIGAGVMVSVLFKTSTINAWLINDECSPRSTSDKSVVLLLFCILLGTIKPSYYESYKIKNNLSMIFTDSCYIQNCRIHWIWEVEVYGFCRILRRSFRNARLSSLASAANFSRSSLIPAISSHTRLMSSSPRKEARRRFFGGCSLAKSWIPEPLFSGNLTRWEQAVWYLCSWLVKPPGISIWRYLGMLFWHINHVKYIGLSKPFARLLMMLYLRRFLATAGWGELLWNFTSNLRTNLTRASGNRSGRCAVSFSNGREVWIIRVILRLWWSMSEMHAVPFFDGWKVPQIIFGIVLNLWRLAAVKWNTTTMTWVIVVHVVSKTHH